MPPPLMPPLLESPRRAVARGSGRPFSLVFGSALLCGAVFGAVALGGGNARATDDPQEWARVTTPAPGPAQALGSAAAGCLVGGVPVATPGADDLVVLRPQRHRYWGHPELAAFLADVVAWRRRVGDGPLLLGDTGQARGGPLMAGHRSHMNGLDVDLWLAAAKGPPWSAAWRAAPKARSVVSPDGRAIDPAAFTPAVRRLLHHLASDPRVERLFVNPVIKRALCQEQGADPEAAVWLARVRPWWGHDSHVHVRLACPADSPLCKPGPPLPPGAGCEEDLLAWLERPTTEAFLKPSSPSARAARPLPEACARVLRGETLAPTGE